jgi:hypothetical protein
MRKKRTVENIADFEDKAHLHGATNTNNGVFLHNKYKVTEHDHRESMEINVQ